MRCLMKISSLKESLITINMINMDEKQALFASIQRDTR